MSSYHWRLADLFNQAHRLSTGTLRWCQEFYFEECNHQYGHYLVTSLFNGSGSHQSQPWCTCSRDFQASTSVLRTTILVMNRLGGLKDSRTFFSHATSQRMHERKRFSCTVPSKKSTTRTEGQTTHRCPRSSRLEPPRYM